MWFLIVLLVIILIIAVKSIKVVRQSEVYIIERLGKFHKVTDAGLTIIIPFVDRVRSVVSLKQQTMDVPPQNVITKDNVTITIDTVVFYKVTDPAKAVYEIQSLKKGIEYLAITTIRDIVGKMDLDSTFSSRDMINEQLRAILDEATDSWGCKIDRVEIKDITPPADIRDSMEKQMNAERTKRGISALTLDSNLSSVATKKSQDMVNKNYFDHTSPTYGSPFDMMKQFGISYRTAGENIAKGQKTPQEVVTAWMNSEGHRKNILNPNFTNLGVGIAKDSKGTTYWTQMFIGK